MAEALIELLPPVGWADVATGRDLDHLRSDVRADLSEGLRGVERAMRLQRYWVRRLDLDRARRRAGVHLDPVVGSGTRRSNGSGTAGWLRVRWSDFPRWLLSREKFVTMALDARTRSSLLAKFAELVGDDDANALMSQFPSIEAQELVTEDFLRAELETLGGALRHEIADLRRGLRGEMTDLRGGLRGEMADLRGGLRGEMADLRGGLRGEMADVRGEVSDLRVEVSDLRGECRHGLADLRAEMAGRFRQQTVWLGGGLAAATAFLAALQTIA